MFLGLFSTVSFWAASALGWSIWDGSPHQFSSEPKRGRCPAQLEGHLDGGRLPSFSGIPSGESHRIFLLQDSYVLLSSVGDGQVLTSFQLSPCWKRNVQFWGWIWKPISCLQVRGTSQRTWVQENGDHPHHWELESLWTLEFTGGWLRNSCCFQS